MMSRTAIYLVYFLLLADHVSSQVIYERTYSDEFPSIQIPIELSDTSTFSLGSNDECGRIRSRHIDVHGNELTDNILHAEGFSSGYRWLGHDSVLVWIEYGSYDVGPDSLLVFIWTPNEINKILSADVQFNLAPTRRYGAFLYHHGRIVYEKSDTLYTKKLDTSVVDDSLVINGIFNIIEFQKEILVFSDDDPPVLYNNRLRPIYEWQSNTTLPFNISQAVVLDSFLVGQEILNPLSLGIINVYDESIAHLDLSSYFSHIEDIQVNKNSLFVKGISNGVYLVLQLGNNFEIVDLTPFSFPELDKELTFNYYPDRVYAWGYDGLANYKANYRMSYKYIQASPIKYLDIALDTMWIDSIYLFPEQSHLPARVYISAVIRNLSTEPVHFVTLHYEEERIFFCEPTVHPYHFESLNVPIGDIDTIPFQTWSRALGHGSPMIRRFYVSHANHHFDDDITNNSFELMHILSSTDNPIPASISVFPNPFIDILSTTFTSGGVKLVLYDQVGRIVSQGQDQLIKLGALPTGMYFLNVQTGSSSATTRVVKVE